MKICLVDPSLCPHEVAGENNKMRLVVNAAPSLGLGYLAAVLEGEGYEVRVIDATIGLPAHEELLSSLKKEGPQIIGITATTAAFVNMKKTAEDIRKILPSAIIVAGGAHVTAAAEYTMSFSCFDAAVLGEGEITFLELVREIERHGLDNLENIDGLIYRKQGMLMRTRPRRFIQDLDRLPYPARHLQPPLASYQPTPASCRRLPLATMITSRGCPSECVFCDRAVFGSSYRERSVADIIGEIEELIHRFGAREIRFFDDTFTLNTKRVLEFCRVLQDRKIKIPWTCLTKAACVSEEVFRSMKKAGCWQVLFGLESGDERILRLLGKGNTLAQNEKAVRLAKRAGLGVRADFIVGTPEETPESLMRTLRFALRLDVDYAHFNKFIPFPGTRLYADLTTKGYVFDFTRGCSIVDHSSFIYVPESMSQQELKGFLDFAHRAFYLRPGYILKRLFSLRTLTELKGQIRGFQAIHSLKLS